MAPEILRPENCTAEYLNEISRAQFIIDMYCTVCQSNHSIIYDYIKRDGENGFILYEKWDCRPLFIHTNNCTQEPMIYSLVEVITNLKKQLDDGIQVQYL